MKRFLVLLCIAFVPVACNWDQGLDVDSDAGSDAAGEELPLIVTFIDVWQGDSALFELPDGQVILIDGGDEGYGASSVIPVLDAKQIDTIDLMVLTHPHSDHCGGLDEIMNHVTVMEIWDNGETNDTYPYNQYAIARDGEGATLLVPARDYSVSFGEVSATVMHVDDGYKDFNNDSIAIMFFYRNVKILTTGDVEREAQEDMLFRYGSALGCDVLKAPHHGSSDFHESFVLYASPQHAVISSGTGNQYGHPHQESLAAYNGIGAVICRTDQLGTVEFTTDGTSMETNCN